MSLDQDRANAFIQRLVAQTKALKRKVPIRQEQIQEAARKQKHNYHTGYKSPDRLRGSSPTRRERLSTVAFNRESHGNYLTHIIPAGMHGGQFDVPIRRSSVRDKLAQDTTIGSEWMSPVRGRTRRDVRDSMDYFKRTGQQRPEALKIQQQREHATIKPKKGK